MGLGTMQFNHVFRRVAMFSTMRSLGVVLAVVFVLLFANSANARSFETGCARHPEKSFDWARERTEELLKRRNQFRELELVSFRLECKDGVEFWSSLWIRKTTSSGSVGVKVFPDGKTEYSDYRDG